MLVTRVAKILFIAALAAFASIVAFDNTFAPSVNFPFVQHVFMMDTVFPHAPTKYRAIDSHAIHLIGYILIVAAEALTAVLLWYGAYRLLKTLKASAQIFNNAKQWAIGGLTLGFLVWTVGFLVIGGQWFGMWMSSQWNGVPSAFRFFITIIAVLIFVVMADTELDGSPAKYKEPL